MRFVLGLCALLCLGVQSASAQSLDQLAAKSAFVKADLKYLKRIKAVSAYAGTKPYCPSIYWWSSRPSADRGAQAGYTKQITREMSQAGFPATAIAHCVKNSGFTLKSLVLQPHPKNTKYQRYVQAGVMVHRNTTTGAVKTTPILVETHTFGKRSWKVYDASFKELCRISNATAGLPTTCKGFGTLKGRSKTANGRSTFTLSNGRFQVMFLTLRGPGYAKTALRNAF